jgi:hypothetical protein
VKTENTYDPTKYIRGGDIIQTEKNNEKAKADNKPRSKSTLNDRSQGNSTNRTKEVNEFDQIENKFSYDRRNSIYNNKQNVQEPQQQNQTEINENINNPYAQINLNNNVSFAKNKYQQQSATKRSNTSNMCIPNSNQNNFDFSNHQKNQMNNQFDFLRTSTTNNMNNRNMNPVNNHSNFNFNQNYNNNNSNINQGINYNQNTIQNNNNNMNNFDFGMIDFTNTNNLQQNINNANNAVNFYQNNQSQIHTFGNQAININNNLNNVGIATGIPTTNFNFPKNSNENPNNPKNDDIFKDFFK